MSARRSLRGLLALLVATVSLLFGAPAQAASCNGASHQVTLTSGSVVPGSGTTATIFTFSVVYTSNAGCAPTTLQVTVVGVGTFSMTGTGTNYAAGVTFQRSTTVPVGNRAYSFRAVAGSGPGIQTVTLTAVSPATVNVVGATPAPTPVPPPPTPKPPPPPPPPTPPPPTAVASPSTTASGAPSNSGVIGSSSPGTGTPSAGGNGGWGLHGPDPFSAQPGPAGPVSSEGAGLSSGMTIWLMATIGGLGLFLLLNRQAPRTDGLALAGQPAPPMTMERGVTQQAAPRGPRAPRGEAQMARWLRPSVQAARYAQPGRYPRQADDEPDED